MSNDFSFGIKKAFTPNTTPSEIVFFDTSDPNTGGTVFDPNTPATADTLYVSSVDASTWIYSGGAYISYTAPATASTPFYLWGTTIDAGSNKTASILRYGQISVANPLGYLSGYSQMYQYGFTSINNVSTLVYLSTSSNTASASVLQTIRKTRGTASIPLNVQSGDAINKRIEQSLSDSVYYELTEATENHTAGISTGVKKVFQTTKNGSATLEDRLEFTSDGYVKLNGAYKMPNVDGTSGQVLQTDGAGNVTWESGASSGVFGIANSSGVYTYYATLTLAMAAATSGDTIEMFADVVETGSVTITLKDGVKINGNGHTYTLSVNDATDAFTFSTSGTSELFNLKVLRTGRTVGTTTGFCLYFNSSNAVIRCQGVNFENTFGTSCSGRGKIYGANSIGYIHGFIDSTGSASVYSCYGQSTGNGIGIGCNGEIVDSTGVSVSSVGIQSTNGKVYNCIGISTSGNAIQSGNCSNSTGISTSGYGANTGVYRNCVLVSTSNYGAYRSTLTNCSIVSSSAIASFENSVYNCYIQSTSNIPVAVRDNTEVINSNIYCAWNNASGNGTTCAVVRVGVQILNCNIKVTNASAYCINTYIGCTVKFANNSFAGSTTPVNTTNVTQGITNTSDSQGNILI